MVRNLTETEIGQLSRQGCRAEDWNRIKVSEGFDAGNIWNCQFRGEVHIGKNVYISNIGSYIANYIIEDDAYIENTGLIETTGESTFGNGVVVTSVNEAGGREVPIWSGMTAQTAYMIAMYRHRPQTIGRFNELIAGYCQSVKSTMGRICKGASVRGCGSILNVWVGPAARLFGATVVENGTVNSCPEDPAVLGFGAKAHDFISMPGSKIDNGALVKHCFVGEATHLDNGFMAENSLFFANCDCGNGEACAIFAGPYTVTHHKSSLLIAGMFSFFNAGSGTNQSNHLFKTGAVHQGIHQRGCKFASNAYAMLPAKDGAFTVVFGRHASHYNTEYFPFSYLMDVEGKSYLLPAANLRCYGMVRDIAKWPKRDKRKGPKRDLIHFDEHNPFLTERVIKALHISADLLAREKQDTYNYERMRITQPMLRRGVTLYRLALDTSLGAMFEGTAGVEPASGKESCGHWTDIAGMYAPKTEIDAMLDAFDTGEIPSLEGIGSRLTEIHHRYPAYVRRWALCTLSTLLHHEPSAEEIEVAVEKGRTAAESLLAMTREDAERDRDSSMSVGYGIDAMNRDEIDSDFGAVKKSH